MLIRMVIAVFAVFVCRSSDWYDDHSLPQPRGGQWGETSRPHGGDVGEGVGAVRHTADQC